MNKTVNAPVNQLFKVSLYVAVLSLTVSSIGASLGAATERIADLADRPERAPSLPSIGLSMSTSNLSTNIGRIQKELKQSMFVETNPNLGSFTTQVSVELPASLADFGSIKLVYNSQNSVNNGMGIGWSWGLPSIIKHSSFDPGRQYSYKGPWGNFELVQTNEPTDKLTSLVQSLTGAPNNKVVTYRPALDEGGFLFLRIMQPNLEYFLGLSPDGSRWLFSNTGEPIRYYSKTRKFIALTWEQGLLKRISPSEGTWSTDFSYSSRRQKIISYKGGEWVYLPEGLDSIFIKSAVSGKSRTLRFSYDGEYLRRAAFDGGVQTIFSAEYESYSPKINNQRPNEFAKDDKKIIVDRNGKSFEIITPEENTLYVDLNGDNKTDRVIIDMTPITASINSQIEKSSSASSQSVYRQIMNKILEAGYKNDPDIRVEIAVSSSADASVTYVPDPTINIKSAIRPKGIPLQFVTECNGRQVCVALRGAFQFVDVNQDGMKDIIYIPNDNDLAPRSFSAWMAATFNGLSLPNRFDRSRLSEPTIFVVERDLDKLKAQWETIKASQNVSTALPNVIVGYHKVTLLKSAGGLSLNHESQLISLGDNRAAWFTGDRLQIVEGFDANTKTLIASSQPFNIKDFLDHQFITKNRSDLIKADSDLSLIKLGEKDRWQLASVRGITSRFNDSSMIIAQNGISLEVQPGAPMKLMSKVVSSYGGQYIIKYKLKSGIWTVSQLVKKNLDNVGVATNFNYRSLAFDPFRGTWLGFSAVILNEKTSSPLIKPVRIKKQYYVDASPHIILYASRHRLNGRPLQETTFVENNVRANETQILPPEVLETADQRMYLLPGIAESRKFERDGSTIYARRRNETSVREWVNDFLGRPAFPLSTVSSTSGIGLRSNVSDDLLDSKKTSSSIGAFSESEYLLNTVKSELLDRGNKRAEATSVYTYSPDGVFMTSACQEKRCTTYHYDNHARLKEIHTSKGTKTTVEYSNNTPLPTLVTDLDGSTQVDWDYILAKPVSTNDSRGGTMTAEYTVEGLTRAIYRGSWFSKTPLFAYTNLSAEAIQKRQLEVQALDRREVWRLDGFGDVIEKLVFKNGKWVSMGREERIEDTLLRNWTASSWDDPLALSYQAELDGQHRPERETILGEGVWLHRYNSGCALKTLNQQKEMGVCLTSLGNTSRQTLGAEVVDIETLHTDNVVSVPTYGMQYKLNKHLEIVQSEGTSQFAPSWRQRSRRIDDQGTTIVTDNGFKIIKDPSDRVVQTTSQRGFREQIQETNTFKLGLLREVRWLSGNNVIRTGKFDYNPYGELKDSEENILGAKLSREIDRDSFGRPESESVDSPGGTFSVKFGYAANELVSLSPWISLVERDPLGNITRVQYSNGLMVERKFVPHSKRVYEIKASHRNQSLYAEVYGYDNVNQINTRQIYSPLNGGQSKEGNAGAASAERFDYNPSTYHLVETAPRAAYTRDGYGNLKWNDRSDFHYRADILTMAGKSVIFSDASGRAHMFCAQNESSSSECAMKVSPDEFVIAGRYIRRVQVDGLTVGVWIAGDFYPVVTDHLGSVKAFFTPNGKELIFTRHYDAWGSKTLHVGSNAKLAKALDLWTPWSYAGLTTNWAYEKSRKPSDPELYWSETRVYSPQAREWLTVDPFAQWNPNQLLKHPGNWHPTRYAANSPLMYVDTSGGFAFLAPLGPPVAAGVAAGMATFGYCQVGLNMSFEDSLQSAAIAFATTSISASTGGLAVRAMPFIVRVTGLELGAFASAAATKVMHTSAMTAVSAGIDYQVYGSFDLTKSFVSSLGYTSGGAALKWAPTLMAAELGSSIIERSAIESTKGFLGATYSFVFKVTRETLSDQAPTNKGSKAK